MPDTDFCMCSFPWGESCRKMKVKKRHLRTRGAALHSKLLVIYQNATFTPICPSTLLESPRTTVSAVA